MSKITSFGPHNLENVRAAMAAAMAKVEEEFGISIKIGGIKYTTDSIKTDVTAMIADPLLEGLDPKFVQELLKYRETKDLFKKETMVGGVKCTIVGIKPRTTGTQAVVRRSNDNSLRIVAIDQVRAGLVK
jgi:hypothetical protein